MILEEFDYESEAMINPCDCTHPVPDIPKLAVTCFSYKTFGRMLEKVGGEKIAVTKVLATTMHRLQMKSVLIQSI